MDFNGIDHSGHEDEPHDDGWWDERRERRREAAYDISEITFPGSRLPVTCMVHNYSGCGALLEAAATELPARFILANHARRERAVCQVVWRKGPQMGVRFLTAPRQMA